MCLIMTTEGWQQLGNGKVCSNSNQLEGEFRPYLIDPSIITEMLEKRSDRFCALMREGQAAQFNEPLYGAFGEKL